MCETQHVIPSPLLLSNVFQHPLGHELPRKQNGPKPYHLHKGSAKLGAIVKNKSKKTVVVNIDEAIMKIIISILEEKKIFY